MKSAAVTSTEAIQLLKALAPRSARDLTPRKFRYSAAMLGMAPGKQGDTALYDVVDLALIRLLLRLEASGLSRPLARFAVVCIAPDVRALLQRSRPIAAVVVVPVVETYPKVRRPFLTSEGAVRAGQVTGIQIPVRDLTEGLQDGIREIRARRPMVWWRTDVRPSSSTFVLRASEDPVVEWATV